MLRYIIAFDKTTAHIFPYLAQGWTVSPHYLAARIIQVSICFQCCIFYSCYAQLLKVPVGSRGASILIFEDVGIIPAGNSVFLLKVFSVIQVISSYLEFIYTSYVVCRSLFLVHTSSAYLRSRPYSFPPYSLLIPKLKLLMHSLLVNFFLSHQVLVGHFIVYLCQGLNCNPFSCTFVRSNIVILTWYDISSYSIVLPMWFSAFVFHALNIYFRCNIYVTT